MKVVLLILGLTVTCALPASEDAALTNVVGSKENFETIRHADRVDACALTIDWDASAKSKRMISTEGPYIAVKEADASFLKTTLLDPDSYTWSGEEKDCAPDYHLRVRFARGASQVEVDFCFGCDILQFHRGATIFGHQDFDPSSKVLFPLFLRLFPEDPTMKMLHERREAWAKKAKRP